MAAFKKGGKGGPGRPKGQPNKSTAVVKDMILKALEDAHPDGGAAYLAQQAKENPGPFLALVGKVLPLQLTGDDGGPVETVHTVKLVGPRG